MWVEETKTGVRIPDAPPLLKAPKPLPRTPELRLKPRQKAPTAACPPTMPTPLPVSPAAAMAAWWV